MLLHAGAGLHGHEYSSMQPTKHHHHHFHHLALTSSHSSQKDFAPDMSPQPSPRPVSQLLPGMSFISSFLPSTKSLSSDFFLKDYLPARFRDNQEEASDPSSTEAPPRPQASLEERNPNFDTTTCSSSQCSKKKRTKTRFQLARPVPGSLNRHRRSRPRLLLQLKREHHGRPLPSIEVVPATDIAGSKLNSSDILIMRSEYDKTASFYGKERATDDVLKEPDVLAVMSPRGGAGEAFAEIAMEDGSVWCASQKPNGSYEFVNVNDQGISTVVRWIKRSGPQQFSFCTMDPTVTRHPFLGSLKPYELDIFETYTPSYSRLRTARPASYAADGTLPTAAPLPRLTAVVSDDQKRLMTVTAIWVSFCEEEWPGTFPKKPKAAAAASSRRTSDDHAYTAQPILPTSPSRETCPSISTVEHRPCSILVGRSPSTGAAYMERRRAAARETREASPSSTESAKAKDDQQAEKHAHRRKIRAWAHKLFHSESKTSRRKSDRL